VDDLADDSSKVTVSLGEVDVAELGGSLVQARVGRCKLLVLVYIGRIASFDGDGDWVVFWW
jgi:hypothetical protein